MTDLNAPERERELVARIRGKRALLRFYEAAYRSFAARLADCPPGGHALEIGSGGGFAKDLIPELITSDLIAYTRIDVQLDARRMPFPDQSIKALLLFNVFHHIPDASAFLREASRVLVPGGRILMLDQYPSRLSRPIYRYLHHEPFDPGSPSWQFDTAGPLSGANGALAWIVFQRDFDRFSEEFPEFALERFEPHSPLAYWLAGGLKKWSLIPGCLYGWVQRMDAWLARLSRETCSFVTIDIVKR